jgi:AbrB family looped-hinge helix DNA binding protein
MRITAKGQVTIPEALRREAGLLPGTDVEFVRMKQGVLLKRVEPGRETKRGRDIREHLERLRGSAGPGWTTEEVMRLTRGEE